MSELSAAWQLQRALHRADAPEELVKLVFQARHGVGHLLSDEDSVTARIAGEMALQTPDRREPLLEPIGESWLRINLRPAMAYGLTAPWLARLMLLQPAHRQPDRAGTLEACLALAAEAGMDAALVRRAAEPLTRDQHWLPSHSGEYRERERPAYRLIHRAVLPVLRVLLCAAARPHTDPLLICVDGRAAAGKTTLASALGNVLGCSVVHTDDYVIPHRMKTPARLAVPGGNCDAQRLSAEVLRPFQAGGAMVCRAYDCHADQLWPPLTLPPARTLVLEGSYSLLPDLTAGLRPVRVFVSIQPDKQRARILSRNGEKAWAAFRDRWIPLEEAYFRAYDLPAACELVLQGTELELEEIRR